MRIHIPSLPHTETTREWQTCAFTTKIRHLSDMLTDIGHEVILYSGENNEANCSEHVVVSTEEDRQRWFGEETYRDKVFDRWGLDDPCWVEYNNNVISAMESRVTQGDFLALPMGKSHEQIAVAFPNMLSFESGIGYEAIIPEVHHVFESYAWMHNRYGAYGIVDGRFYDTVIPNAFDPNDFCLGEKENYVLYLGRHTYRKGLAIVEEVAKHHRVVTAGQGELRVNGAEYVGVVKGQDRADLLSKAKAVLVPTIYIEPFGGVVVEAQMSGTVPITTDFGAFTETIEDGVTGFRCHVRSDFLEAIEQSKRIDSLVLRKSAIDKYSTKVVAYQYDDYLKRLNTLYEKGWYSTL